MGAHKQAAVHGMPGAYWSLMDKLIGFTSQIALVALAAAASAGCSSTPGARPHDMSAEQHEAMAAQEDASASQHLRRVQAGRRGPNRTVQRSARTTVRLLDVADQPHLRPPRGFEEAPE